MKDSDATNDDVSHSTDVHLSDTVAEDNPHRYPKFGELLADLSRSPELARNRSFVIERAVAEYNSLAIESPSISPREYASQFSRFGSSLQSSIARQVELEGFVERFAGYEDAPTEWPTRHDRVGQFEIIDELGRGGLSRVYLCRQHDLGGRQVVVKLGSSMLVEAHTLGQLRHPNIVPIYSAELDRRSGRAVLCMPFLGRSTLHDLTDVAFDQCAHQSGAMLWTAARIWRQSFDDVAEDLHRSAAKHFANYHECVAYIGERIADALAHAHGRHIVHGDIKPSNILLSEGGEPLLMDFNLSGNAALAVAARGGTWPYMPPEQVQLILGDVQKCLYDERSDIYSLGAVLYELLTGKTPFLLPDLEMPRADVARNLLHHQSSGFVPLLELNTSIPVTLARAVERCLAHLPENRYSSAEQAREAFSRELLGSVRLRRRILAKRHLWTPVLILFALLGGVAATFEAARPPRHIRQFDHGKLLQTEGRFAEAKEQFERALAIAPEFEAARFELGRTLLRQDRAGDALKQFAELTSAKQRARDLAYLAYCFSLEKGFTAALPWYDRAAKAGADGPEFHNNFGVALDEGRNVDAAEKRRSQARDHLSIAVQTWPHNPTIRLNFIAHEAFSAGPTTASVVTMAATLADEFPKSGRGNAVAALVIARATSPDDATLANGQRFLIRAIELGAGPSREQFLNGPEWLAYRDDSLLPPIMSAYQSAPQRSPRNADLPRLLEPVSLCDVSEGV